MTISAFLGVQILGAQPHHDAKGQCRTADTITIAIPTVTLSTYGRNGLKMLRCPLLGASISSKQKSNHVARNGLAFLLKPSIAVVTGSRLRRAFAPCPAGSFAWVGLRWCGAKRNSSKRPVPVDAIPAKARAGLDVETKCAKVFRDKLPGTSCPDSFGCGWISRRRVTVLGSVADALASNSFSMASSSAPGESRARE